MASMVASDFDDSINISVFEQSSPESLRPRAPSPHVTQTLSRSTSNIPKFNHETEDDYFGHVPLNQCTSNRSSISSFPSSVIHTIPATDNEGFNSRSPSRSQLLSNGRSSPAFKASSNSYLSAFRHPNSVRALQLESEYADSDNYSIARSSRHRKSPKISYSSPKSPGSTQSSPTKRSTRPGTPQHQRSNSKLKKEFPLVLLHCTLLPPATTARASSVSEEILEAVLPEDYRKRWRTLQDKVTRNPEVKQRGVLIAHPRDDYDLLEERLLEALELERPRIRKGHYMGNRKSDSDSGFESSSQTGTDDGSDPDAQINCSVKEKCPDCGKSVSCTIEQFRKWEVKIFAANGLMRSDAWSAAWEQMEKIDVEVAVWMPEAVRFEVEERLKALQAMEEAERSVEGPAPTHLSKKVRTRSNTGKIRHDERMREIYGEPERPRTQEEIDGLVEPRETGHRSVSVYVPHVQDEVEEGVQYIPPEPGFVPMQFQQQEAPPQVDFVTFMKHRFRIIVNDQRNLAIVLLSVLVLFFSVQNLETGNNTSSQQPGAVQSGSVPTESLTETSVISVETPVVSYITTTVMATPSHLVHLTPPVDKAQDMQSPPHEEDYKARLNIVSNKLSASSTMGELIMEDPSAESERGATQSFLLPNGQQERSDIHETVSKVDKATVVKDGPGTRKHPNTYPLDSGEDVRIDHEAVIDDDTPIRPELSTIPIPEITAPQDLPEDPEEHIEPPFPSEISEQFEKSIESPTELDIIDLPSSFDTTLVSIPDNSHPDLEPDPEDRKTNDHSNTNIYPSSPEHLFTALNKEISPLNFLPNPKDTTSFSSDLPSSSPSHLLTKVCMEADHDFELQLRIDEEITEQSND